MAPLDEYLLAEGIIVKPVHPTSVNRHNEKVFSTISCKTALHLLAEYL